MIQVNFPMVTSFLQDFLRSPVFKLGTLLAFIKGILLLKNIDEQRSSCRDLKKKKKDWKRLGLLLRHFQCLTLLLPSLKCYHANEWHFLYVV